MGYAPSALSVCPDIQVELNNFFNTCNSSMLREPTPLFDFMMSPVNRGGYSQAVAPGQGKLKTIITRYDQRILESEVTQPGGARSCTATTKRGDLTNECTIDPDDYWEVSEKIDVADFIYACSNNFDIVARKMTMMMNALVSKVATDITDQVVALKGDWEANVDDIATVTNDELIVQTLKSIASGDISPLAFEKIDAALALTNFCNGAAIFSGTTLWEYYRLMLAGCCSTQGLALDEILSLYGKAVLFDKRVHKALGANSAIAIQPGSVQTVTYNQNDNGIGAAAGITVGASYLSQIILDPQSGLPIDLTVKDECPGEVHIFMRATVKACGLPTDLYAPGDDMEGVVYVNGITVTNS